MSDLKDEIKSKLLEYQIEHSNKIVKSLKKYGRALDASDTGTGKTFSSIGVAKNQELIPLIICPKSVISGWKKALEHFNLPYYGITNYELIKNCRWYQGNFTATDKIEKDKKYKPIEKMERSKCPFITREKNKVLKINLPQQKKQETSKEKVNRILNSVKSKRKGFQKTGKTKKEKKEKEYLYKWKMPSNIIIIFDEAHRCKNKKTTNSDILSAAGRTTANILILSATIADKPEYFAVTGFVLGLYNDVSKAQGWLRKISKKYDSHMAGIHDIIFPNYASRMRIKELGNLFPTNKVFADCFEMDKADEIEEQYKIIEEAVEALKSQRDQSEGLGKIIKARMMIEMLKIPTFLEIAKAYIAEKNAVAIFVNFTETLLTLAHELKTNCLIFGEQTYEEREKNISDFVEDRSNVIICNIRAGGVGISLHDTIGNFPRVSVISPSWSAQDIIQVIGRVHRAKGKTPVRQQLVYCAGTIEEQICKNMIEKIKNIAFINDRKTNAYKIKGLLDEEQDENAEGQTQTESAFAQIQTLLTKRERLLKDLSETDIKIEELKRMIQAMF